MIDLDMIPMVVRLQALFRGTLARKNLKVLEFEGSSTVFHPKEFFETINKSPFRFVTGAVYKGGV